MKYYVYTLIDPRTNIPFYVGKGYKRRMYSHELETKSGNWNNKVKCQQIQDIWDAGFQVQYIQEICESDEHSRYREKELIKQYGRLCNSSGILTNVHVGGNGGGRVGKPVRQYTSNGDFIAEYKSASQAERETGVLLSKITAVCRGDWNLADGFQWRWKGQGPINNYKRENVINRTTVYQYTIEGNFVAEYESQQVACAAINGSKHGSTKISACCQGKIPSYKGFQWKLEYFEYIPSIQIQQKQVHQYTLDNVFIRTYKSITEAYNNTKINRIGQCCNGKIKQSGGYIWRFISS